jgi:hypothetical protein
MAVFGRLHIPRPRFCLPCVSTLASACSVGVAALLLTPASDSELDAGGAIALRDERN